MGEYYNKRVGCMQINETLLRSIVTQPPKQNYVYAHSFAVLSQVRNLLLGLTCRVVIPDPVTTPPSTLPPVTGTYSIIASKTQTTSHEQTATLCPLHVCLRLVSLPVYHVHRVCLFV